MSTNPINIDIFSIIHNRRSIRKFSDEAIPDDVLQDILNAGIRAPFAAQLYSIIYTRNRDKMRLKSGVYPSTSVFLLFLLDFNKIEKIVKKRNYEYDFDDGMLLWLGIQDVTCVAENIILAAEGYGLGSVLLGAIPLHADHIKEGYNLPNRVFPVVGLCLGYPDPSFETEIRPRYPLKYTAFKDTYHDPSDEEIEEMMGAMDEGYITQGYYIKQNAKIPFRDGRTDEIDYDKYSWSEHISRKLIQGIWGEERLFEILERHGINVNK
ncbi:MAG: nitroreductase family protein [Candidatus Hodarchaeales archaeon]